MVVFTVLALVLGLDASQAPGLRIRVLAGEGVVNVVQQKTAVSPVVEVTDRNGLPVAGASVTFSIVGAGLASFPGDATTFTVTTDAQGHATAAAITPFAPGTFAIRVQATAQGQSGALTIPQTNVATTAKAEAAAKSPAPVPIGGKGVSKVAIGVIGAAVAGGGAIAATRGGDEAPPVTVTPTESVTARAFRLTGSFTGSLVHNVSFPAGGGTACTIEHVVLVELTSDLTMVGSSLSGFSSTSFRATVTDAPVSWTCADGPLTGTMSSVAVGALTGSASGMAFRWARNFSQMPEAGVNLVTDLFHEFSGAFDGTIVSGNYTFDRKTTRILANGVREQTVSRMTIPVTLR